MSGVLVCTMVRVRANKIYEVFCYVLKRKKIYIYSVFFLFGSVLKGRHEGLESKPNDDSLARA